MGKVKPQYVARFCGDYIGSEDKRTSAALLCVYHDDERTLRLLG